MQRQVVRERDGREACEREKEMERKRRKGKVDLVEEDGGSERGGMGERER